MYKELVVTRPLNIILIHNFVLSVAMNQHIMNGCLQWTGVVPVLIHNQPTQSSMETWNYRNYCDLGRGILQDLSAEVPFKPCQEKWLDYTHSKQVGINELPSFLKVAEGFHSSDLTWVESQFPETGESLAPPSAALVQIGTIFKFCPEDGQKHQSRVLTRCVKDAGLLALSS